MDIPFIHEDARILAVSKPVGTVVIPGRGEVGTPLCSLLEERLGAKLYVVHRLDREASGLLLFAKDEKAHKDLCAQFAQRTVRKLYCAAVEGLVAQDGIADSPLREFGSGRIAADPRGKPSRTVYRVLQRGSDATLLEVEPMTGRRHQIRAHLYGIGHPILGDPLYGRERPVGGAPRLMLHARKLSCRHPDGSSLRLEAPLQEDFLSVLRARRLQ
ncbi:MAG: RNA pseudouridine synthase [Elusimicrobiota bacterium]|jgi:RluA family pseudouridine synthase